MTNYGASLTPAFVPNGNAFATSLMGLVTAYNATEVRLEPNVPASRETALNNGPQQWATMPAGVAPLAPTELQPLQSTSKATSVAIKKVEAPARTAKTSPEGKPSKIPQWAWDATSAIDEPVARIAIAHLLSKECDPTDIHKVVNHPHDPGGLTKYGIAQRYHPAKNVANLTIQEAVQIYYSEYWTPNRGLLTSLPSDGMRVATLDAFAHHGVEGTKKLLKEIATQLTPDALGDARVTELRTKKHADSFMKGWEPRINEVTAFANSIS